MKLKIKIHSGSTYCVCPSRLLKHPLQAIKWDVKPLNPLSSLQVVSACRIVWCLYLRPRGTAGNEARGRRHRACHLLSISWLNFHCCGETESPPSLFPSGWCLEWGSLLCEVGQDGVRKRGKRWWERWRCWSCWGSSQSGRLSGLCRQTLEEGGGGEKEKFTGGRFFSSSLRCPVITHTYTEAYVNSHVGSERQIEIWAVRAGLRMTTKERRKSDQLPEKRGGRSFTVSLWTTLMLLLVVYSHLYSIIFSNSMISAF